MVHHFDTDIAKEVGVNAAVVFQNILFWCTKNKANGEHFYDGRYWTYNSIKAWHELLPYLTEKQIRISINKLKEHGYIATGNYNNSPYDRTTWYSPLVNFDLPKKENGKAEKGEPIPDNKPDNKHNITASYDTAFEDIWKHYTLKFLKAQGRRGGSKSKAYTKFKKLINTGYSISEIKKAVAAEMKLKIGHRDLERVLTIDSMNDYQESKQSASSKKSKFMVVM